MHAARIPSQDEVLQSFRRAGLSSLTPLQQKLIPLLVNRRDAIAEVPGGGGTSSAIAATLALGLRGAGPALRALVLLPTAEDVGKLARAFARFVRAVRDAPAFVALGETADGRREQRRLERESTVVAGTTDRVIDHIRRGGLSFGELEQVIMREPQAAARADFVKDVQFISAKWAERPRVVLISRGPLAADDELVQLLHHPVTMEAPEKDQPAAAGVQAAAPASVGRAGTGRAAAGPSGTGGAGVGLSGASRSALVIDRAPRAESLARVILGLRLPPLIALHSQKTDARAVAGSLKTRGLRALVLPPGGGRQQADRRDALIAFSRRAVDVLLVPFTGTIAPDLEDLGPTQVVLLDLPTGSIRSPGGMLKRASVLALVERERDLGRLQEAIGVAFQRNNVPDDDALVSGAIDRILRRAKEDDPAELTRLRDRIRRQVPFLTRPFFMASLLKALLPAGATALREKAAPVAGRSGSAGERASGGDRAGTAGEKPAPGGRGRAGTLASAPAPHIPPKGQRGRFGRAVEGGPERAPSVGDSAQLFVSVGRNRRVFARDLTDLFTEKLQLSAGDIRDVRVFDKYSFVDIAPAKAEEAIRRLSGIEVKGRPITVNYAKKKEEKGAK